MRIVIVDDHAGVMEETRRVLHAPDFEVIATAETAKAALDTILALKPDCAVLDISMPDYSGIELARRLRGQPDTKLVFLTIHEDLEFVVQALAAGASGYVLKSRIALDLKRALVWARRDQVFISPSIQGADYASMPDDR